MFATFVAVVVTQVLSEALKLISTGPATPAPPVWMWSAVTAPVRPVTFVASRQTEFVASSIVMLNEPPPVVAFGGVSFAPVANPTNVVVAAWAGVAADHSSAAINAAAPTRTKGKRRI